MKIDSLHVVIGTIAIAGAYLFIPDTEQKLSSDLKANQEHICDLARQSVMASISVAVGEYTDAKKAYMTTLRDLASTDQSVLECSVNPEGSTRFGDVLETMQVKRDVMLGDNLI